MEKYRDYFNEWDADVAFGINGKSIFYVLAGVKLGSGAKGSKM